MPAHIIVNVANWHADKACEYYLSGNHAMYARHMAICDALRWSNAHP